MAKQNVASRSPYAKALENKVFARRVIRSKKLYSRKGRNK